MYKCTTKNKSSLVDTVISNRQFLTSFHSKKRPSFKIQIKNKNLLFTKLAPGTTSKIDSKVLALLPATIKSI